MPVSYSDRQERDKYSICLPHVTSMTSTSCFSPLETEQEDPLPLTEGIQTDNFCQGGTRGLALEKPKTAQVMLWS